MKRLFILLALLAQTAFADDCRVEQTSQMTAQRTVGAVTDLVKDKSPGQCQVKFRINVDGDWHTVNWKQNGLYQEDILCQMAIKNGTNDLLVQLPGKYATESKMSCKTPQAMPVTLGYEGNENEFGQDPGRRMYFKIGNVSNCRMFKGHYLNGVTKRIDGVICENKNSLWTIVDKF